MLQDPRCYGLFLLCQKGCFTSSEIEPKKCNPGTWLVHRVETTTLTSLINITFLNKSGISE